MCFFNVEKLIIKPFCDYLSQKREATYSMKWKNNTRIIAEVVSVEESDNNLELEDPLYEEFVGIVILIKKINNFDDRDMLFPDASINSDNIHNWFKEGHLYELNYHNFPDEIYNSKGELISKKEV